MWGSTWGIALNSSDRVLVCLLLGSLGLACRSGAASEPLPRRLVPGWGLNTAPVPGTLEGDHFLDFAIQHVGGQEPVTIDSHFEAFLGDVALEDVVLQDEHSLGVRIPAGIAPGWYTLRVVGPLGQRVELPHAYYASERELASLEAQATWEQPRLRVGQSTQLRLDVTNPGGTAALGVTALLHLEDAPDVVLRSGPAAQDIAPGASIPFTWELDALQAGTERFTLELQGQEELTATPLAPTPVGVTPLEIRDQPVVLTSVSTSPEVVNLGQSIQVTLHVTNTGSEALHDVTPGEPQPEGVPATRLSGPEPASADLAAGESRDFVWTYGATQVGSAIFQVDAVGSDAFSGEEVRAPAARSSGLLVQRPGALLARFPGVPSSVTLGTPFDVQLEVSNTGDSLVRGVQLEATGISGSCQVNLVSGPTPASLDLAGGDKKVFQAKLSATSRGTCTLRAGARGQDSTDGTQVSAAPVDSSALTVR